MESCDMGPMPSEVFSALERIGYANENFTIEASSRYGRNQCVPKGNDPQLSELFQSVHQKMFPCRLDGANQGLEQ